MKARFPELYSETCTEETDDTSDEDVDQDAIVINKIIIKFLNFLPKNAVAIFQHETIHPIKMPWESSQIGLNNHARRLVEEIEGEPSLRIKEIPELEEETEDTSSATITEDDESPNMPLCILEYMKEMEKQKLAKSLSSADETLEVESGMKSLPEELHFPLNERVAIREDVTDEKSTDEEEVDVAAASELETHY